MIYIITAIAILVVSLIIELLFEPRIDVTPDNVFLWYGIKTEKRKYIKIL